MFQLTSFKKLLWRYFKTAESGNEILKTWQNTIEADGAKGFFFNVKEKKTLKQNSKSRKHVSYLQLLMF